MLKLNWCIERRSISSNNLLVVDILKVSTTYQKCLRWDLRLLIFRRSVNGKSLILILACLDNSWLLVLKLNWSENILKVRDWKNTLPLIIQYSGISKGGRLSWSIISGLSRLNSIDSIGWRQSSRIKNLSTIFELMNSHFPVYLFLVGKYSISIDYKDFFGYVFNKLFLVNNSLVLVFTFVLSCINVLWIDYLAIFFTIMVINSF